MENENILQGGVTELQEMKEVILKHVELQENIKKLNLDKKETEERLQAFENDMKNEAESTVKKRQKEITDTYDRKISEENRKLKKINDERDKVKKQRQNARITEETKEYVEENKMLDKEIGDEFRHEGVPAYCNTTFYYAMFFTKTAKDWIIFIITALICLAIIPGTIDVVTSWHWIVKTIVHIVIVAIFIAIYITIWLSTKDRFAVVIGDMRYKRDKISENKKIIKDIKKKIKLDEDEKMYDLGSFDEQKQEVTDAINQICEEKEKALDEFEKVTKVALVEEIEKAYVGNIDENKNKLEELEKESENLSAQEKELETTINSKYKGYIGEEFLDVVVIDEMISLMGEENIETVGQVIRYMENEYKTE